MLSIIGQARASIQSPAFYNLFVTVQDFTLFLFLPHVCISGSVKNVIYAKSFSLHKCM